MDLRVAGLGLPHCLRRTVPDTDTGLVQVDTLSHLDAGDYGYTLFHRDAGSYSHSYPYTYADPGGQIDLCRRLGL
jgi:hypothetical protein